MKMHIHDPHTLDLDNAAHFSLGYDRRGQTPYSWTAATPSLWLRYTARHRPFTPVVDQSELIKQLAAIRALRCM